MRLIWSSLSCFSARAEETVLLELLSCGLDIDFLPECTACHARMHKADHCPPGIFHPRRSQSVCDEVNGIGPSIPSCQLHCIAGASAMQANDARPPAQIWRM